MLKYFQNLTLEQILFFIIVINIAFIYFCLSRSNSKKLNKKDIALLLLILTFSKVITTCIDHSKIDSHLLFDNTSLTFIPAKDPITNFCNDLINMDASLSVFLGVVSLLTAIYLYCINLENNFKRHVLMTLLGQGKVLYMSILLLILYCIGISPILFLSLISLIFIELYRMIQEIFSITNTVYFKENWKEKIIPRLREQDNNTNLANIYYQLREEIVKSMTENNFITFAELFYYYRELLMTTEFEIPDEIIEFSKSKEDEEGLSFFYAIYKELQKNNNDNFFNVISNTGTTLGEYYIDKKNKILGYGYCRLRKFKYHYLKNNKSSNKELMEYHLFTGYKYCGTLDDDISEDINVYILKSTLDLFNEMIKEDDYVNLLKFQDILGKKDYQFIDYHKNNHLNEYARLILIFILEKKKSVSNSEELENTLNELKKYYILPKHAKLLEDIYDRNKEYDWDDFFKINWLLYEGQLDNISTPFNSVNDIILQILNERIPSQFSEHFILNNYEKIEDAIERLKLTRLEMRMNLFSNDIKLKKAKKKSEDKLTNKAKEECSNLLDSSDEETEFFNFFKTDLSCKLSIQFMSKETFFKNSDSRSLIKKNSYLNDCLVREKKTLIIPFLNVLNEKCFLDQVREKAILKTDCNSLQKENYFLIVPKKEKKEQLDFKTYSINAYDYTETFLIKKDSIKEIIFYVPEGYDKSKYTYLNIQPCEYKEINDSMTLDEKVKELENKGKSTLKIFKKMEIVFSDNPEIYKIVPNKEGE